MDFQQIDSSSPDSNAFEKKAIGKDVGKLVSGTLIAQAIGICLTPVITRIFSPEIYGVASVFISIVSIIVVISCLRYELSILLPNDDKEASAILFLCFFSLIVVSIISFVIMLFLGDWITGLLGCPDIREWLYLIPLAAFVDGLYLAIRYWNTRRKRFGTQAVTQALQAVSGNGLKLCFGFAGCINAGSLIITGIIGNFLGTVILFGQAIKCDFKGIVTSFSLSLIWRMAKRYKKFPLIDSWSNLMNVVSWQLPVLMLTSFFSSAVAGLYALGFMIIQTPMNFIGGSIRQVFIQRGSIAKHDGTLPHLTEDICSVLIIVSVLPFLLLCIVGGDLFALVFGSQWYDAGVIASILAPWAMIWFVASIMSELIYVLEIQGFGMVYNILNLLTRLVSLLIGGLLGNVYLALTLFMLSGICVYLFMGIVVVSKSNASIRTIGKNCRKAIIVSVLLGGCSFLLSMTPISPIILCISTVILGLGYIVYLLKYEKIVCSYIPIKINNKQK